MYLLSIALPLHLMLLLVLACSRPYGREPETTPKDPKAEKTPTPTGSVSKPMDAKAAEAALLNLRRKLAVASGGGSGADLSAWLRAQGIAPTGSCDGQGPLMVLDASTDEALADDTPAWQRGLLVLFRDPENPACALPNYPCAITVSTETDGRFRLRAGELELDLSGRVSAKGELLTGGSWLYGVTAVNSDCGAGAATDGDDGPKGEAKEPVTRAVVLLHHLGRFSVLHTYLAHVSFQDGKGLTTQTGEHTIHRIARTMAGEDAADYLFMLADTMETKSGMEAEDGEDQLLENWLCSWIDLDSRSLREVKESELAQLGEAGEAVAERCGKTRVNGRSPDAPGEADDDGDGNDGPGCRSRDTENPCSMDDELRYR